MSCAWPCTKLQMHGQPQNDMGSLPRRRAAHSAAANIAEGCAKRGSKEFRRYLDISLGSLSELSYTLMLARDLKILAQDQWLQLNELHGKAGGMTWLLYKSLFARKVTAAHTP